jgi:hypothetical protein
MLICRGLDDVEKRKILPLPGLELRPLGYSARRCTDYAIPALENLGTWGISKTFFTKGYFMKNGLSNTVLDNRPLELNGMMIGE